MAEQSLRQRVNQQLGAPLQARYSLKKMLEVNAREQGGGFLDDAAVTLTERLLNTLNDVLGPERQEPPRPPRPAKVPKATPVEPPK